MSYRTQLQMRCNILEYTLAMDDATALVGRTWQIKTDGDNVKCFLDLFNIRPGKDPVWTPDSQTAQNRKGTFFLAKTSVALPGNRIQMLVGPTGTFEIKSAVDEAWTPRRKHHIEMYVEEVDRVLAET